MSKHTPEPWFDDRATHDQPYQNIKILGDENRGICWLWIDDAPVDDWNAEQRANAKRIVTCVNACAGMEDPAEEIAELKRQRDELLAVLNYARDYLGDIPARGVVLLGLISVMNKNIDEAKGSAS